MENKLKIKKLLDKKYMTELFWKKRDAVDKRIKTITSLKIKKIKFYDGDDFQHAVVNYQLHFYDQVAWPQHLSIYVSAHSDGSRASSFRFMKYIHSQGFNLNEFYSSTKPLFYLEELKASFHQEIIGNNLTYIIEEQPQLLPEALIHTGKCLAKFHKIPNPDNFTIRSYPFNFEKLDPSKIIERTEGSFVELKSEIKNIYSKMEKFYKINHKVFINKVFSHGDFHMENVIIGTNFQKNPLPFRKVAIIDYTDICLADRGLDLGSFIQKIFFLNTYKLKYDPEKCLELENIFLHEYLKESGIKLDDNLQTGMDFWYAWNNLRVIINYFLFPDKREAMAILKKSLETKVDKLNLLS